MSTPVLVTKLFVPPPRPKLVPRPRLTERLNEGLQRKLTLISAPAGFGKTTLVGEWVEEIERPTAWLSLDEGDSDPARFLAYLVAALQTLAANIGEEVLGLLQSSQPPPTESILTALLNEVAALPDDFVLVLDDYHAVDAEPVDLALTFLLEHLPPRMHLVIATREDPRLPLARLRARGQLTELRAADLRFTAAEAADFLNRVMGLSLSAADIAALEARTEGWIAGLQLAALSMRGHADAPGFIRAFAGDHRYVVDYLVEEVLRRQPEAVRDFLLQTAILDRLNGALCNAVTGREGGEARLEALERGNFFVIPLDDRRRWYRYHHLFAEVLKAQLTAEQPDQVPTLHRRASAWFERNGEPADAIRRALAAGDFERAADLVERAASAMRAGRQEAMLLGWLKALPDALVRARPVLSGAFAWALLASGELEAAEARLRDAERWLAATANPGVRPEVPPAGMMVADEVKFRRLPGSVAIYRAAQAQALGDFAGAVRHARRALDLMPEEDPLWRGAAEAVLGLASWASGDLETAHRTFAEGLARVRIAGNIADAVNGTIALADIRVAQGRLREAVGTYERALRPATAPEGPVPPGTADLYVGLSELDRERGDLDAAAWHLRKSEELGERAGLPQNRYRRYVAKARLREAQGDPDGALDLLDEAERLYMRDFFPNVRPVAAWKARAWVAQGRLGEALGWAREHALSVEDDLSYLREFEHITLVRVLLAQYARDRADRSLLEAMGFLDRLLQAAEAGERTGSVLEILVLQALAHQTRGDLPAALAPLGRALALAEPEGCVRIFVDEGPPMAALLEKAAKNGIAPNHVRQLRAAFGRAEASAPVKQVLAEPLSEREHDVLRLLGTDLGGPDIARELMVSLNTLRTHTKNIYAKLGVNNCRAAVRRAEELALLSRARNRQPRTAVVHRP
jgi:LuxR family maltose regulon positive regulatory protein